jgi:hypothetical protein
MTKTNIRLKLVGEDGNAFAIMGRATRALKKAGKDNLVDKYINEATSGDYNHLLATTSKWFKTY